MILGGSGLVGSHLLACLRERGHQALGTCWRQEPRGLQRLSMRNISGITEKLKRGKFDALAICSGFTWVDECERKPKKAKLYNSILPGKIARICKKYRTKTVYLSTSYIFDGKSGPYTEKSRPNPICVYGYSKMEGEIRIKKECGKNYLIIRTMGVVGYESTQKNFLYTVVSSLSLGKKLAVAEDQKGNLTCATDLARGIAMLLEADKRGIYHVAGIDPHLRRIDVARKIAYQYGLDKSLILPVLTPALAQKAQRPANAGLSIHKIRKELRFIPKVRLPSPNEILPDLGSKNIK